jgi:hypothetical protein
MQKVTGVVQQGCRLGRWTTVAVLAAALWGFDSLKLAAQTVKATEYEVKAAYLRNFARFVEWPSKAQIVPEEPFHVCVLGRDPFGSALETAMTGEMINRAQLVPLRIPTAAEAANCRVLFISASEDARLKSILATLDKSSLLTVSDVADFTKRGGMIQFVTDGGRIRFEVNLAAARQAGLNLSSELLKVASSVRREP